MKNGLYTWLVLGVCVAVIAVLVGKVSSMGVEIAELKAGKENNTRTISGLQGALKSSQASLAAVKESAPGLGEYMTTIQLHMSKLWFAAKAANWELAEYEVGELKEAMEVARGLNAVKNGAQISNLLDAVLQTQVAELEDSLKHKSLPAFQKSYDETLTTCNGCHGESGFKYIQVVRPTVSPVSGQKWEPAGK